MMTEGGKVNDHSPFEDSELDVYPVKKSLYYLLVYSVLKVAFTLVVVVNDGCSYMNCFILWPGEGSGRKRALDFYSCFCVKDFFLTVLMLNFHCYLKVFPCYIIFS